jgi:hypothetical protein
MHHITMFQPPGFRQICHKIKTDLFYPPDMGSGTNNMNSGTIIISIQQESG